MEMIKELDATLGHNLTGPYLEGEAGQMAQYSKSLRTLEHSHSGAHFKENSMLPHTLHGKLLEMKKEMYLLSLKQIKIDQKMKKSMRE